jgi:acyl-ACP thioesterase
MIEKKVLEINLFQLIFYSKYLENILETLLNQSMTLKNAKNQP